MIIYHVNVSNPDLEFLDPKDELFRLAVTVGAPHCLPKSQLLTWDCENESDVDDFPSIPALLKAPLGSGGFGLYFVYSKYDVLEVIRCHKKRAVEAAGFIDRLLKDYQRIPAWTLQQLVPSVKIKDFDLCKTQLRSYVVLCNGSLFLYPTIEVRLPFWDIDLDSVLSKELLETGKGAKGPSWSDPVEAECVGRGHARPYNEGRNRKLTRRVLLSELTGCELEGAKEAVHRCVAAFFKAACPVISQRAKDATTTSTSTDEEKGRLSERDCAGCEIGGKGQESLLTVEVRSQSLAIIGVDLVVCREERRPDKMRAYIVEVNNNPAMPQPGKHSMSPAYKSHLEEMATAILSLGLSQCMHESSGSNSS